VSDERFEVINEEIVSKMRSIGDRIHNAINESDSKGKMGFALFLFEFGDGGATFYISDAQRADMVSVLEEFIAREKKR
jgi:hypothetical protein